MQEELVTVHSHGSMTRRLLSQAESDLLEKRFLESFDPVTLESRSLQKMRAASARTSPPEPGVKQD